MLFDLYAKSAPQEGADGSPAKVALPLIERTELSHDTHMFRFGLPTPEHILGLPIGQHIALSYTDKDGKEQGRPYTPTSSDVDKGHVDFVIKVYFPNERFPEGGKVSQHMHSLKIGDTLDFSGPKGRYEYRGKGTFTIKRLKSQGGGFEIRKAKKIGMIAGGTGITPMLQVMRAVMRDGGDKTQMSLIFANQTEQDILLRDELEALERDNDNFKLHYTVDRPPAKGWKYDSGFVTAEMIEKHMPPPGKDTQILLRTAAHDQVRHHARVREAWVLQGHVPAVVSAQIDITEEEESGGGTPSTGGVNDDAMSPIERGWRNDEGRLLLTINERRRVESETLRFRIASP